MNFNPVTKFRTGNTVGYQKGCIPWNKGKHHSEETKQKMRGQRGKKHDILDSYGYVLRYIPELRNRRPLHRILMEEKLGRKLLKGEEVHHINHIKTDNRIENLELIQSLEHKRLHGKQGKGRPKSKEWCMKKSESMKRKWKEGVYANKCSKTKTLL